MIRFFTALIFVLLLSVNTYSTEHLRNSDADALIRGTEELWFKSGSSVPSYIRFQKSFVLEEKDVFSWLKDKFKLEPGLNYILKESHQTEDQIRHNVYTAVLNDVPFEFTRLIVHTHGQRVLAISGDILDRCHVGNLPVLTAAQALDIAVASKGSAVYKWEVPTEERWLQEITGNVNATFYPRPEMVIVTAGGDYKKKEFRHAYKMNLYSQVPLSSENYYVDAESGQIIFIQNMWNDVDSTGVAHTAFSGIKLIKSQYNNLKFNLVESDRGNGIHTWNMKNLTDFSSAIDFEDEDNNWTFTQGDLDAYATDAHWGAEMTYDYLKATFNRNSINDSGFVLNNYVHFGEAYNNARWDRQLKIMMFGDGPSNLIPLTTLDIVAHEIGHGLTQFTADLIYMDEPGALNESFSDILGNSVEFFGKPGTASWRIGEDMGDFVRDMAFPNAKGHPDTYKGDYWYTGLDDNGGVHTNSGVQNFWFYLLSQGGNGINDFNVSYDVQGIGISNAALIAYRTLSVYLTPTSDYEEASFYSTMAAVDIFGNCSFQHESVVKAWNAVGLQNEYIDYTLADFKANNVNFCNLPITIAFANQSLNGEEYVWDFGDGITSTLASPTHIYTQPGAYTVKLSVDGKGCGTDEIVKENLVQAFETEIPGVSPATIYKGDSTVLYASTSRGEINWYADEIGNNWLKKGNSFQTPKLDKSTTYYLRTTVEGSLHGIGEEIAENLSQGQFSNLNVGLIFNTYQDVVIHSVKVNSESAGDRTFQVKNESGSVIFDKTVSLAAGVQEVILDAVVQAGSAYQMTYSGALKNLWMGAQTNYPYEYSGLLSITGNSMGLNDVYAYFFDWQVKEMDCNSDMKEVVVSVEDINTVKKEPYKFYVNNPDDFNYYIDFFFRDNTNVNFGLYGINGQRVHEFEKEYTKGATTDNVNILFGLDSYPSGVYFITINGGGIEKTEKIISKGGSD